MNSSIGSARPALSLLPAATLLLAALGCGSSDPALPPQVPAGDASPDAACAASGQSCSQSGCCRESYDMCFAPGICGHASRPPEQGGTCNGAATSTLPGVRLEFPGDESCVFTEARVAQGIEISYRLVVDADIPAVHPSPQDDGRCQMPESSGLITHAKITGQEQTYCQCDLGPCPGQVFTTVVKAGIYPGTIRWDGRNFRGHSDTNNKPGAPFPPGHYALIVSARGTVDGPGGAPVDFEVMGSRQITIQP